MREGGEGREVEGGGGREVRGEGGRGREEGLAISVFYI